MLVLVAAILAVLLLWPDVDVGPTAADAATEPARDLAAKAPSAAAATADDAGEPEVIVVGGGDPSIPVTEKCQTIIEWQERRVPDYTIMDNIRDQAMLFTEDDLACLTGSSAKPFVLTYAEIHMKKERTPR